MLKILNTAIAGLSSSIVAINNESNNIANVNTTGYKSTRTDFADLFYGQKVGHGTQVNSIHTNTGQGNIKLTKSNTDLALSGSGYFIVNDGSGEPKYTRDGHMFFKSDGTFVNNQDDIVQGWLQLCDDGSVDTSKPIQDIIITHEETCQIDIDANLNSGTNTYGEKFGLIDDVCDDDNGYTTPDGKPIELKDGQGISVTLNAPIKNLDGTIGEVGTDDKYNFFIDSDNKNNLIHETQKNVLEFCENTKTTLTITNFAEGEVYTDNNDEIIITGSTTGATATIKKTDTDDWVIDNGLDATVTFDSSTGILTIDTNEELTLSVIDDKEIDADIAKGYTDEYTKTTSTADGEETLLYTIKETMNTFELDFDNFANNNSDDILKITKADGTLIAEIDKTGVVSNTDPDIVITTTGETVNIKFNDVQEELKVVSTDVILDTNKVKVDELDANIDFKVTQDNTNNQVFEVDGKLDTVASDGIETELFTIPNKADDTKIDTKDMATTDILYIRDKATGDELARVENGVLTKTDETNVTFTLTGTELDLDSVGVNFGIDIAVSAKPDDSKRVHIGSQLIPDDFDWAGFAPNYNIPVNLDLSTPQVLFTSLPPNVIDKLTLTFNDFDFENEYIRIEDPNNSNNIVGDLTIGGLPKIINETSNNLTNFIDSWDYSDFDLSDGTDKYLIIDNIKQNIRITSGGVNQSLTNMKFDLKSGFKISDLNIKAYDINIPDIVHIPIDDSIVGGTMDLNNPKDINITTAKYSQHQVNFNFLDSVDCSTGLVSDTDKENYSFDSMASLAKSIEDSFGTNDDAVSANFGEPNIAVTIENGKFVFENNCDEEIDLDISGANSDFASHFFPLDQTIPASGKVYSHQIHTDKILFDIPMDIYDENGHRYDSTFSFTKIDEQNWKYSVTTDGLTKIGDSANSTNTNTYNNGIIKFDSYGNYISHTPNQLLFLSSTSSDWQNISIDLEGITAKDMQSQIYDTFQNGFNYQDLNNIIIDDDGVISAVSNRDNDRKKVAQIAIARFTNEQNLSPLGDNYRGANYDTGSPIIKTAKESHSTIVSNALEMSNVDLGESLVNLMVKQKAYEANAKSVTTANDILTTIMSLKR
ncbi:MAG: flagellar hook-basal body complex protein [Campylobacterota bacterium]|nr:flagellar hook-basal body complex protein [Campylobacterota bacterium]